MFSNYAFLLTFQILFSTWFFRRPASEGAGQRGRAADEVGAAEGAEQRGRAAEEGAEQMTSRLANLLLRQFSVRTDFRDLNISVPQSM